jgi:hypothetical protein
MLVCVSGPSSPSWHFFCSGVHVCLYIPICCRCRFCSSLLIVHRPCSHVSKKVQSIPPSRAWCRHLYNDNSSNVVLPGLLHSGAYAIPRVPCLVRKSDISSNFSTYHSLRVVSILQSSIGELNTSWLSSAKHS